MLDLDLSLEIIDSTPPKKEKKNLNKSPPRKLTHKNRIRRSSIFDKAPRSKYITCTELSNQPIIIISSSSSTVSHSESNIINEEKPVENQIKPELSKLNEIENWLDDNERFIKKDIFNSGTDDINLSYDLFYLESKLKIKRFSNETKINSIKENNIEKETFVSDLLSKKVNLLNIKNQDELKVSTAKTNNFSTPSFKHKPVSSDSKEDNIKLDNECGNEGLNDNAAEKLLDDLYGNSWRDNKDEILSKTEPRKKPKKNLKLQLFNTEKKPTFRNIVHRDDKSSWGERLRNLCDSDTSDSETNSNKSLQSSSSSKRSISPVSDKLPLKGKKLDFNSSDEEIDDSNSDTMQSGKNKKQPSLDLSFNLSDNDSLMTRIRKNLKKHSKSAKNSNKNVSSNSPKDSSENSDNLPVKIKIKVEEKQKELNNYNNNNNKIIKKPKSPTKPINKTDKGKLKIHKAESKSKNNKENDLNLINAVSYNPETKKYSFLKSLSGGIPSCLCDSEAQFFRVNYKTQKTVLAQKLFKLYNEKIFDNTLPSDMLIQWNERMRGTAGFCYNSRVTKSDGTIIRSSRINLSTKVLDTADRLRDTLLHEMCHAATWLINKISDGHGPYWKSWTYKALKTFPELPPVKVCHDYKINTKYTYKCINCGYSIGRHSKSLDIERKRCGYCYGKFEIFINKISKNGETQVAPATPKGKPTGFALFVKENYSSVKRRSLKHGEVMKILGQKFSELKVAQTNS